ncbi:NAD(P)-dependent oxidoreductase [Streptococcus hongkongensis]
MIKAKILILGQPLTEGVASLKETLDVLQAPKDASRNWILEQVTDVDGILTVNVAIDQEIIDKASKLKMISTHSVGYDHIDVDYAAEKGIIVSNAPETVLVPTAELTMGLMIDTLRHITYFDKKLREKTWSDTQSRSGLTTGLKGKTLAVYGFGRIGQEVARLAQAFGMTVIYNKRSRLSAKQEAEYNVSYRDFEDLIAEADVLTLHAPATTETKNIIDGKVFAKMKSSAYLINTARGALVNQDDLKTALETGAIAGFGGDVFIDEPRLPVELLDLDNVVLTPHIGTATLESRIATGQEASDNLIAYFVEGRVFKQVN